MFKNQVMVQAGNRPLEPVSVPHETLPAPVVDIESSDAVLQVKQACTTHGFLYVSNHGVDKSLIAQQFEAAKEFFALPTEVKLQTEADSKSRGYTPLGEQTLDPKNQKKGDTKESYYVWSPDSPAESEASKLPFHGPNQWPDASQAPLFKPTMQAYMAALTKLAARVRGLLAEALDLPADWFEPRFQEPLMTLRPIHYTAEQSSPTDGVFGCGAHTDWGFTTFLVGDGSPGLQLHYKGAWLDVPQLPDTFIVNLGDMLQQWTNGKFQSTLHRVVNLVPGHERYSCAFFVSPSWDAKIECLPTCDPANPKYPPTTSATYLKSKYAATHSGFAERNRD